MSDPLRDELAALTADLVRFHSTADRPDQLAAAIDYIEHYLAAIPGLYLHRSERNEKPSLVATLQETRAPTLMLNGHIDVVAALPEQFEPQVRAGRLYGRGSQDMKGSVAVFMRLLKDLAAQEPRPDVGVQFVSDEEIGGTHGTRRLLQEGWRCDYFIAGEPTDMRICHEQKGGIWLKLRLPGKGAHASRPWNARNPLLALGEGLQALEKRFPTPEADIWRTTATPTAVHSAMGAHNQVPPSVTLLIDIRHTADDAPDDLVAAVQVCFPTAEIVERTAVSPLHTRADEPALQQLACVCEQVLGQPTPYYREHFASDARFYSEAHIPAICFGPVGAGLHADDEWVDIASLAQFYEVLRAYIER